MPLPSTPVITASSTTARTVSVSWDAVTDTTRMYVERSTNGVDWIPAVGQGGADFTGDTPPFIDRGLTPSTLYYYRTRGWNFADGYGSYSNTVSTTTLADPNGIEQYYFSIRMIGGMSRGPTQNDTMTTNTLPPIVKIPGVFELWLNDNPQQTQPGGPGTDILADYEVIMKYWHGNSSEYTIIKSTGYPFHGLYQAIDGLCTQDLYQSLTNQIDVYGRVGSCDNLTYTHTTDGEITVKVDGVAVITLTSIALGTTGTAAYDNVYVGPHGSYVADATPGGCDSVVQNGGLISFQMGCAEDETNFNIFDYTFSEMADADLFVAGPWERRRGTSGVDTNVPTIWDGKLSDSYSGGFATGWMLIADPTGPPPEDPAIDPPSIYPPGSTPTDGYTGIFVIDPGGTFVPGGDWHDTYYEDIEVEIPDPTIRTALLGD